MKVKMIAALTALVVAVLLAPAVASPASADVQPQAGAPGVIYRVDSAGTLLWYRHTDPYGGDNQWMNGGIGRPVGTGWNVYSKVVASCGGAIYGIRPDGTLFWYLHLGYFDGSNRWANGGVGRPVGTGWHVFDKVVASCGGVLYGIRRDGTMLWYRHLGVADGTNRWANAGNGRPVGTGWHVFSTVVASDQGTTYGIRPDGRLLWYRHLGVEDGTNQWANGGNGREIGTGWQIFDRVKASDDGIFYGALPNGQLLWYRHLSPLSGTNSWVSRTGKLVGSGWFGTVI